MKKIFILLLFTIASCSTYNCGTIVDKYEMNGTYFFTLTSTGGSQNAENPGGGGQVEVTRDAYNSFIIGEEYCNEW